MNVRARAKLPLRPGHGGALVLGQTRERNVERVRNTPMPPPMTALLPSVPCPPHAGAACCSITRRDGSAGGCCWQQTAATRDAEEKVREKNPCYPRFPAPLVVSLSSFFLLITRLVSVRRSGGSRHEMLVPISAPTAGREMTSVSGGRGPEGCVCRAARQAAVFIASAVGFGVS